MSRLVVALAVVAIVGLVGIFVPVNGVTLAERWGIEPPGASPTGASAPRAPWAAGPARGTGDRPARAAAPPSRPAPAAAAAPPVEENHSPADREALDRLVSRHAGDRPPRR